MAKTAALANIDERRDVQAELRELVGDAALRYAALAQVVVEAVSQPDVREKLINDCTVTAANKAPSYVSWIGKFMEAQVKSQARAVNGKQNLQITVQQVILPPRRDTPDSEVITVEAREVKLGND